MKRGAHRCPDPICDYSVALARPIVRREGRTVELYPSATLVLEPGERMQCIVGISKYWGIEDPFRVRARPRPNSGCSSEDADPLGPLTTVVSVPAVY